MSDYKKVVDWWKNKHITNDAELAEVLNGYQILFAYNSGKIENDKITFHDTREIFEHDGVTSYTGDLRTLFEIRNAKDANEFFMRSFNEHKNIDIAFIKEMQFYLTQNTYDTRRYQLGERPGELKKHDYVTGRNEIGAAPEDVEEELTELLDEIQNIPEDKTITAAAYFHVKFENIHPFADGNGRTGRLAMNYFLILHNHPPVIIHEENRLDYYLALEAWDTKQDLSMMKNFLVQQSEKTWGKQVRKSEKLSMNSSTLSKYLSPEPELEDEEEIEL